MAHCQADRISLRLYDFGTLRFSRSGWRRAGSKPTLLPVSQSFAVRTLPTRGSVSSAPASAGSTWTQRIIASLPCATSPSAGVATTAMCVPSAGCWSADKTRRFAFRWMSTPSVPGKVTPTIQCRRLEILARQTDERSRLRQGWGCISWHWAGQGKKPENRLALPTKKHKFVWR